MKIYKIAKEETYLSIPTLKRVFIRFGDIPKNEQSISWEGNRPLNTLEGVSVFEAWYDNKTDLYVIDQTGTELQLTDPYTMKNRPVYLVTGDEVGEGPDYEPLLKNIKIIKKINLEQLVSPDSPFTNFAGNKINVVSGDKTEEEYFSDKKTEEEYLNKKTEDTRSPITKIIHEIYLKSQRREPIDASIIDKNNISSILPKEYVKEGDYYVFKQ